MTDNRPITCGVAGVGYLGCHHARLYHDIPSCQLVGVYDIEKARARAIADEYSCRAFSSLEELGAVCEAVSIVVPTDKHCEVALSLLPHNCHLLIEKPLCHTLSEAEQILQLAKVKNCLVQVGHIEHFNPVMTFLEDRVNNPRFISAERLAPFVLRGTEVGVVLDLMIHDIGIILQLVKSPVVRIDSVGVAVLSVKEDMANVRMVFESGCVANLNTSRVSQKKVREIRLFQENTYLSLDFMNQSGHLWRKEGSCLEKEIIPIEKEEPLKLELLSFIDCVRRFEEPKVSGQLGRSALEVALQITEQIKPF